MIGLQQDLHQVTAAAPENKEIAGREADISVLKMLSGRFELRDNSGVTMPTSEMITPAFALRADRRVDVNSPLVPTSLAIAA